MDPYFFQATIQNPQVNGLLEIKIGALLVGLLLDLRGSRSGHYNHSGSRAFLPDILEKFKPLSPQYAVQTNIGNYQVKEGALEGGLGLLDIGGGSYLHAMRPQDLAQDQEGCLSVIND